MKCYICNTSIDVVKSNNKLVQDICINCLSKKINFEDLEEFTFFCRTYNLYWEPSVYIRAAKLANTKQEIVREYIKLIKIEKPEFIEATDDTWKLIKEEWEKIKTHTEIKSKIAPIREGFLDRCRIKWGPEFNFEDYVVLESLYTQSVKAYGITDPIKQSALKKSCKLSLLVDRAIAAGDSKTLKELISSWETTNKISGVSDLATVSTEGRILTVSDLYAYMERNGFEFNFYDGAPRDIVDFTIKDIKDSIRHEIQNATGIGLESILEKVKQSYENKKEEEFVKNATEELKLKDVEDYYDELENKIDEEYAAETFEDILDDELEY